MNLSLGENSVGLLEKFVLTNTNPKKPTTVKMSEKERLLYIYIF